MKNKYQEALSDMVDNGVTIDYFNEKAKLPQSENPLFTIQELVDKETPEKPTFNGHVYFCGKCGCLINRKHEKRCENYCDNCGQRLDWSGRK